MLAIDKTSRNTIVDVKGLTNRDAHGRMSPFMKIVCEQHLTEIVELLELVSVELKLLDTFDSGQIMIMAVPPVFEKTGALLLLQL